MSRCTNAEIQAFDEAVCGITRRVQPATCRQVYYRAVVAGIVGKDDRGYRWVCDSLKRQRKAGDLPWSWVVDETRSVRAPSRYRDADSGIAAFAETYRRDAWREQPTWVEVWCESDSLAGTLVDITFDLAVPLFSGRGFGSLSALRSAAEQIAHRAYERRQPTTILYVGDLDPAGWEASGAAHRGLLWHLRDLYGSPDPDTGGDLPELRFQRLAVNPDDVEAHELPTGRPPKRRGPGSRSWWEDDGPQLSYTVEAEAFEPETLRWIVKDAILEHADTDALEAVWRTEKLERTAMYSMAKRGLFGSMPF